MMSTFRAGEVREILALPDTVTPVLLLAVGKPVEKIVLRDVSAGESLKYYRDESDTHYVPKRALRDLIL